MSQKDAEFLTSKYGILYFETSAKNNEGIDAVFQETVKAIKQKIMKGEINPETEVCSSERY